MGNTVLYAREGHIATITYNRPEALNAVAGGQARVDLLITDVIMPGMRGPALAERLVQIQPNLKVLYISGYVGGAVAPDTVLDPDTPFLQKPFTIAELAAKMRDALGAA